MTYKLIKPAPERIYNPPTIREQILTMCKKQYKHVSQDAFRDESASWIECSNDQPDTLHCKSLVFTFNNEGTELFYVHAYTHVQEGGLTSKRIV